MLGKINSCHFGAGGYDDAMFGVSFTLITSEGSGCGDFWGAWAYWNERCKWTPEDQRKTFGDVMNRVMKLMQDAKVKDFSDLKGVPIDVVFIGGCLHSWRILTEVL